MTTVYNLYSGPTGAVTIAGIQNVTVSANYTVQPIDSIVTATGAGNFTITLPPAFPLKSKNIIIKCETVAPVTVNAAAGEFIDSVASKILNNGEVLDLISDGVKWIDTAASAINGSKITNGTITASKLATGSVTADKLATNSVTADKIATGAVGVTQDASYVYPYANKAFRPSAGTGTNGIIWPENPGGGTGDSASIKYYPYSPVNIPEACRLELAVTNDSNDQIKLTTVDSYLIVGDDIVAASNSSISLYGNTGQFSPTAVGIYSPGYAIRYDWPSGWGGGLATWDITCSGLYYSVLTQRSDRKHKTDLNYLLDNSLQKILKLKPLTYRWTIEHISYDRSEHYGFIAQEVEEIFPNLVTTDIDNNKGLNQLELIPILVKSIQEQQTHIESLEARIKNLENLLNKGLHHG